MQNARYIKIWFFIATFFLLQKETIGQLEQCQAVLKNDTLVLENGLLKRTLLWNNGALQSLALHNKISGNTISGIPVAVKGDVFLPGINSTGKNASFRVYDVAATKASYAYRAAEVVVQMEGIELKRVFKLFADCPGIVCDYYLRGKPGAWSNFAAESAAFKNIEDENTKKAAEGKILFTDRVPLSGNHWKLKSVEFYDASDYNNNLVEDYSRLLYARENKLRGNLLLATDQTTKSGFFILKEAPVSNIQLQYQGFDFTTIFGEVNVAGMGLAPANINDSIWVKGYSIVVGVNEGESEQGLLFALRSYQSKQRIYKEQRDAMILSNTWGDRNRDSRIDETFILQEIEAAAKLGITHLQIDDGWQVGVSSNSALGGSLANIWGNPDYWEVNPKKFAGGLEKVIAAAKAKGIQVTLWFNPSTDSSFKNWEKDADALINQHKKYGITMWKIDGVQIGDKQADVNFSKLLDKVMAATSNEAVFNLDVTAGRRFGYNYMHTYGNLFLENRYTDWTNYYPHFSLRNLWQLSAYIPAQRLQIEFLNKWRNANKYPVGDVLAPANYSFDYLFAITMVAQPLAWFEVSSLPAEAFETAKLITKYKTIAADLHMGKIFPIGDEPGGFSWTGFQSVQHNKGYLLVFRESNRNTKKLVKTLLPAGKKVRLSFVAGKGKTFDTTTGEDGAITFQIPDQKSFALYSYILL